MLARRIDNLTGVRGFAAVWVLMYHASKLGDTSVDSGPVPAHGLYGVDVFFVLSGFVLSLVYDRKAPQVFGWSWYGQYLLRRLAKIYPLHLLTLLASVALIATAWHFHYHLVADVEDTAWTFICQILLLHAFGVTAQMSWNTVSWSVSAEWFAYSLLFAPMVYLLRDVRKRWIALLTLVLWLALLYVGSHVLHRGLDLTTTGIVRITPEFLGGYLVYRILETRAPRGDLLVLAGIVGLGAVCFGGSLAVVLLLPAIMLLVAGLYCGGVVTDRVFGNRIAMTIGEASYSIYLIQTYVAIGINQVLRRTHVVVDTLPRVWLVVLVTVLVTSALGYVSFRLIEEPARLAILRRWSTPSRTAENLNPQPHADPAADTQVSATIS